MKIAIFFPAGGSGKLIQSIIEILLGDDSIDGPTSTGSMHHVKGHEIGYDVLPFYDDNLLSKSNIVYPVICLDHINATKLKNNIKSILDWKIIYIYTTNIQHCITMCNRNMYKFIRDNYARLSKEVIFDRFGIDKPDHFDEISVNLIEQVVVENAIETMKYRPLNYNIDNVLQLNYATIFKNGNVVDKISKFLDLYKNIEHAKIVLSKYIDAQYQCPEYATINSIKKYKRK